MDRLSYYGAKGEPFLFVIDFRMQEVFVSPISKLQNIYFQTPAFRNFTPKRAQVKILQKSPISFEVYKKAFDEVQKEIHKGNTYLLNLTFGTPITLSHSLLDTFLATKAKFKLYFQDRFICFSPERFVKIVGNTISTYPMKGTIDANVPNAKELILSNQKEMAEHTMVVDLLRNDLNMVASRVRVERFRYVKKIKGGSLLQVSSHIAGELPKDWPKRLSEIFGKILPAGSITGTPKRSTCQIIERVELDARNFYTGVFGYFDGRNLDSAVMIRYIERDKDSFIYRSGGGITADSDVKAEYQELIHKIYLPL